MSPRWKALGRRSFLGYSTFLVAGMAAWAEDRADEKPTINVLRIAATPDVARPAALPLLEAFIKQNFSSAAMSKQLTNSGRTEWRVRVPDDEAFVPIAGIVREATKPFEIVKAGDADLVITSTTPTPGELGTLRHIGNWDSEAAQQLLGLEGIAFIANRSLSQNSIEASQLISMLESGLLPQAVNGASPRPVRIFLAMDNASLSNAFQPLGLHVPSNLHSSVEILDNSSAVVTRVGRDIQAVGLLSSSGELAGQLSGSVGVVGIGDCGNSFPLTPATVLTEEYPLIRELYLYAPTNSIYQSQTKRLMASFIDFSSGSRGREILKTKGYAIPEVTEYPWPSEYVQDKIKIIGSQGDHTGFGDFQKFVRNASQLSRIVRFRYMADDLDSAAKRAVFELAKVISPEQAAGRKVLIAGFADAGGTGKNSPARNMELSERRANVVAEQLRLLGVSVDRDSVKGFGQMGYLGCRKGAEKDRLSRRVEVWLR